MECTCFTSTPQIAASWKKRTSLGSAGPLPAWHTCTVGTASVFMYWQGPVAFLLVTRDPVHGKVVSGTIGRQQIDKADEGHGIGRDIGDVIKYSMLMTLKH